MNIKNSIEETIKKAVKAAFDLELETIEIDYPANDIYGDLATSLPLGLAKSLKQNPMDIAKKLCYELQALEVTFDFDGQKHKIVESIEVASPGFINFKLADLWLKSLLLSPTPEFTHYKVEKHDHDKSVQIEFSAPNPCHALHVGNTRNNFIGSSLVELYKFIGEKVISTNYMNDWSTSICKAMLIYKKFHNGETPDIKLDHFVNDCYVAYGHEVEKGPSLDKELAEMFKKLEAGDTEVTALWRKIVDWSIKGFKATYSNENVYFDLWQYQSDYRNSGKEVVHMALDQGIAHKDETGAVVADLEKYDIPNKVLLRSDGTSIYSTQDLQLAKDSFEKYNLSKRIYVTDYRQIDYFKQIFKILKILGFAWAGNLYHVPYGTVELPEGLMSSRKGLITTSDEVMSKLTEIEKTEMTESIKGVSNIEESAKKVALAAFRYGILKIDPKQNIIFRLDEVSKFEGNTGPYVLYTYARAKSILEKASYDVAEAVDVFILANHKLHQRESALLKLFYKFYETVEQAALTFSPNLVANYVFDLAQKFNSFYAEVPIISAESDEAKEFRLHLVFMSAEYLKKALNLLGIQTVERM